MTYQRKSEFLYQLTFKQFIFQVNCFLLEEEDELTLIDAADPGSAEQILGNQLFEGNNAA